MALTRFEIGRLAREFAIAHDRCERKNDQGRSAHRVRGDYEADMRGGEVHHLIAIFANLSWRILREAISLRTAMR